MDKLKDSYQVAIAGGGPVGLFLAIALRQRNIDCVVLEKSTERTTHSRSLGIHPVSLELMKEIGLADQFVQKGRKMETGTVWTGTGKIGSLSFASCPGPYRFVLSLPQYKTERLLEDKLEDIDPHCLVRGVELAGLQEKQESVELSVLAGNQTRQLSCRFIAGCDGKDSFVRNAASFSFEGKPYPDTYIMGDFTDHTDLGATAAIFLPREGLIESFPLGDDRRRWVVKTDQFINEPERNTLEKLVSQRIGYDLSGTKNFMLSSFGVQRYVADPIARGRIYLAGDAAHVVSPIGGQGMNLGWLDAWELSQHLGKTFVRKEDIKPRANRYNNNRKNAAKKAVRRAELNMVLGRRSDFPYFRNGIVWLMLNTPLEQLMARIFTMRGLMSWPF